MNRLRRMRAFILSFLGCGLASCGAPPWEQGDHLILQNGQAIPAELIVPAHPALSQARPVNPQLWASGQRNAILHCLLVDERGQLTRVSLLGIMFAAVNRLELPAFDGRISPGEITDAARRRDATPLALFHRAISQQAAGNPVAMLRLARAAERRDAECLEGERREVQAGLALHAQSLHLGRDAKGAAVIVRATQRSLERFQPLMVGIIQHNLTITRGVITIYEAEYQQLTSAGAAPTEPVAATAPVSPDRTQPTLPSNPAVAVIPSTPADRVPAAPRPAAPPARPAPLATLLRAEAARFTELETEARRHCVAGVGANRCPPAI